MDIPKKLKIGGHIYKVSVRDLGNDICGQSSRRDSTIFIDKALTQSHKEATLFHELFHTLNSELNHTVLDSLAEQLYQVLKDNNLLR